jgi:hypothetical protein
MRPVQELEELSFNEYDAAILGSAFGVEFLQALCVTKPVLAADFRSVNQMRNAVFHFRKRVTLHDTQLLRRFLDRVQRALGSSAG